MTDREAIYAIERLFLDSTSEDYPFTEEFDTACNNAISALKEREKRNRGCEYCKADRDGFVRKIGAFALSYTAGEHKTYLYAHRCKQREINFCPMCGRPLKEET